MRTKFDSLYFAVSLVIVFSLLYARGFGAFPRLEIEGTFNSGFMM